MLFQPIQWLVVDILRERDPREHAISAGKLRPTDRFQEELAPPPGTELLDEVEDVTVFVRVEAEKRGKRFIAEELKSIDDVIRLLAKPSPST